MRVLLTGATGFLGSHVLRRFLADGGHNVAILARSQSDTWRIADLLDQVTRIEGALGDLARAEAAVAVFRPEAVVHLAWSGVAGHSRNDPSQVENLYASLRLLEMSRRAGAKHWIGLGSQAEYGPQSTSLREDAPTRPTTLYGTTKLCTCLLTEKLSAASGVRFVWLRLFSAYGPGDGLECMIPRLIERLLNRERPALTTGEQRWDYVYVEDAAEAVYRAAVSLEARGIYNLGSGQVETIRRVVERIRDLVDPQLPLGLGEVAFGPEQVMHLQADIGRLQRDLDWSPRVPLAEGLKRTVAWHQAIFRTSRHLLREQQEVVASLPHAK